MGQGETTTDQQDETNADVLYTHRARPEWGRAVLAWDRDDKRGFQFEDGKLRVFNTEYLHLLDVTEVDDDRAARLMASLRRKAGWKEQAPRKRRTSKTVAVPLERQIDFFARLHPKGFGGVRWAKEKRGIDTMRRLKRHRDPAILEAQKLLSRDRLEALLGADKHDLIFESLRELYDGTDLVSKAQLSALDDIGESGAKDLAVRLFDLLYGDEAFGIRFERFVDALARLTGKRPPWQLVTAVLALVHPKDHICIKPSSMRRQIACAGRLIQLGSAPTAPVYERVRLMVQAIHSQLASAGTAPRDLVDIYDFIETTATPKVLKELKAEEDRAAA